MAMDSNENFTGLDIENLTSIITTYSTLTMCPHAFFEHNFRQSQLCHLVLAKFELQAHLLADIVC